MYDNDTNASNNAKIADVLEEVALTLSMLEKENLEQALLSIENGLSSIEAIAQETDSSILRALIHWMQLNIEVYDNNQEQIKGLLHDNCYSDWIDVLTTLLRQYDSSLLPILHQSLTEPNWPVSPSAPLLKSVAAWIVASKADSAEVETEKQANDSSTEIVSAAIIGSTEKETIVDDTEPEQHNIFEEVERDILAKEYNEDESAAVLKELEETTDVKNTLIETDKSSLSIAEVDEEIQADTSFDGLSTDHPNAFEELDDNPTSIRDALHNSGRLKEELNEAEETELSKDFSQETDDIVMSLASITALSDDITRNVPDYIKQLERFSMLGEITQHSGISNAAEWCQRNLQLFAENQTDAVKIFINSGECWSWIELCNACISEPDEVSHLGTLSAELAREEWLEPITTEDLQALLLSLRVADETGPAHVKKIDINDDSLDGFIQTPALDIPELIEFEDEEDDITVENSGLQLNWNDDTHPELLTVYLEETPEQIAQLQPLLHKISTNEADKDEKHTASRMAHTIKGGSAIVGITALSEFSYQLETLLDHSVNHQLPEVCLALLPDASTCYESLFEAIQTQQAEPKEFLPLLTKLKSFVENLDEEEENLELSAPVLPDFILNQNNDEVDATESKPSSKEELTASSNLVEEALDDIISETEESEKPQIEAVSIEEINNSEKTEEADDTASLANLDSADDASDISLEIDDIVMTLSSINHSNDDLSLDLNDYAAELQRFDILAEISGYPELSVLSHWCQDNLVLFAETKDEASNNFVLSGESWAWLELVGVCLNEPEEISHLSTLSAELMRSEWLKPIANDKLQSLLLSLRKDGADNAEAIKEDETEEEIDEEDIPANNAKTAEESERENTDEAITEEDVAVEEKLETTEKPNEIISWDKDVHPELLSVYFQETPDQINEVAELLHKISNGDADSEDHKKAARIAHTIKGASGVVGLSTLVDLTHKLEDILDFSVNNELPAETSELLAEASDSLEQLFETIQNKQAEPEELISVMERLNEYADSIDAESTITDDDFDVELAEFVDTSTVADKSKQTETALDTALSNALNTATSDNVSADAYIRVPVNVIDRLLNLAGELVTSSAQVSDHLENTLLTSKQIKSQDTRVHKMLDELSNTISQQEKDQATMLSNLEESDFDALEMDTYNELHSVAGLLTESILDSEEIDRTLSSQLNDLNEDMRSLDKLNKELSDVILKSRMVSLQTLVPRLERIVRQTCRKTGKEAELSVTGNNINIDTDILNGLVDPLLHLLRNAIDHGIESSKVRKKKKKDKIGKIDLKFSREGNNILMQLKDDGAGIDPEVIYQKAIDKGLITPEQEFSSQETLKLILQPGFSTQDNVSDISGRGVGMDVVNSAVEDLKGSLQISSEPEQGTRFEIKIPSTLVTNTTLLVKAAKNPVAIPTDTVEQLLYITNHDVIEKEGKHFVAHNENELEIQSLSKLLDWPTADIDFSESHTLLIIKDNEQLHAIHIEEILYSREVVVKNLNPWVNTSKGVVGACHLNDGGVAPVLNLNQIVTLADNAKQATTTAKKKSKAPSKKKDKRIKQILVVDDSLSNRKALSLIIETTEYKVITAVDGLDALQIMNENPVDMVFTDLEMPRMNGLELTQAIRAWTDKSQTPIVMITSRTTAKHRELAEKAGVDDYLTKPVVSETLLESLTEWIDKKTTVK